MNKLFEFLKQLHGSFIYQGKEYAKTDFFCKIQQPEKGFYYIYAIDQDLNEFQFKFPEIFKEEYQELDPDLSNGILIKSLGKYEHLTDDQ